MHSLFSFSVPLSVPVTCLEPGGRQGQAGRTSRANPATKMYERQFIPRLSDRWWDTGAQEAGRPDTGRRAMPSLPETVLKSRPC